MSRINDEYIADCERGYSYSDQYACNDCIGDHFIKELISQKGKKRKCSFCKKNQKCIEVNELLIRFQEFLDFFYCDPAESLPVDHGKYVGNVYDLYDLIDENLDLVNDELFSHIRACFDLTKAYTDRTEDFDETKYDHYMWNWKYFSTQLKYEMRFFFWDETRLEKDLYCEPPPYFILKEIAENIESLGLIQKMPAERTIYRARKKDRDFELNIKELGAPQAVDIKDNKRMSPAGISMFYGAFDKTTCLHESWGDKNIALAIGCWKTLDDLLVLDLTKFKREGGKYIMPNISIFDTSNISKIPFYTFFKEFLEEINKPISRNVDSNIEYIPTQALAEYFRHIYKTKSKEKLSGILYPSVQNPGGVNVVFFWGPDGCGYKTHKLFNSQKLELISSEIITPPFEAGM